ncbi:hypothetical protein ACS0TY_025864 [Phlomoides rotata]
MKSFLTQLSPRFPRVSSFLFSIHWETIVHPNFTRVFDAHLLALNLLSFMTSDLGKFWICVLQVSVH